MKKELIIFDLDGTLAESKQPIGRDMAQRLAALLAARRTAVITGGAFDQVRDQVIDVLEVERPRFENLHVFPTSGAQYLAWRDLRWSVVYERALSRDDVATIRQAFDEALHESGFIQPSRIWGPQFEDRGSQVTFSALGQRAPAIAKAGWDPACVARAPIVASLRKRLLASQFSIRMGGATSIDVTQAGVDKSLGIEMMVRHLSVPKEAMLFVGDALFEGGNDRPVQDAGVECVAVSGPIDTLNVIDDIMSDSYDDEDDGQGAAQDRP